MEAGIFESLEVFIPLGFEKLNKLAMNIMLKIASVFKGVSVEINDREAKS